MMLVPRRSEFNLLDDMFNDDFFSRKERNIMKTDIRELKDKYLIDIDVPGFEKENIDISLDNGYLNIACKVDKKEDTEEEKYVRHERFYGECSRSFYVGDEVTHEDINAEFNNGTLSIEIPKKDPTEKENSVKRIEIK